MLNSHVLQERNCVKKSMLPCCVYLACLSSLLFSCSPFVLFLCSCHEEGRFLSVPSSVSVKDLEVFEQGIIIALRGRELRNVFSFPY